MTRVQTSLFADLADFTALTEVHGDEFAADVVEAFYRAVDQLLSEHAGEEVKQIGDGVLVRVPRAGDALRFAARGVSDLGVRDGSLDLRVGMHTGSAVLRRGDWFGATVNLAARVAAKAAPGEVLLTAATRDAAGHELAGLGARDGCRTSPIRVELFALVRAEAGPAARARPRVSDGGRASSKVVCHQRRCRFLGWSSSLRPNRAASPYGHFGRERRYRAKRNGF